MAHYTASSWALTQMNLSSCLVSFWKCLSFFRLQNTSLLWDCWSLMGSRKVMVVTWLFLAIRMGVTLFPAFHILDTNRSPSNLIMVPVCLFFPLGVCWAPWICQVTVFINLRQFSDISSNTFLLIFSLPFFCDSNYTHMLDHTQSTEIIFLLFFITFFYLCFILARFYC